MFHFGTLLIDNNTEIGEAALVVTYTRSSEEVPYAQS